MSIDWNAMYTEVDALLEAKGFKESLQNKWQLAALLHTEVIELQLADTAEEKELELADLFIRAMNMAIANKLDLSQCDLSNAAWIMSLKRQHNFRAVDCLNYAIVQYTESIKKRKGIDKENQAIAMIFQALLEYAEMLDLDVWGIFRKKMDINWGRPYRYGTGIEEIASS